MPPERYVEQAVARLRADIEKWEAEAEAEAAERVNRPDGEEGPDAPPPPRP